MYTETTDLLAFDRAGETLSVYSTVLAGASLTMDAANVNVSDVTGLPEGTPGFTAQLSVGADPVQYTRLDLYVALGSAVVPEIVASDSSVSVPLKLNASEIDVNSKKIVNVDNGVDANDAVNKSQLDGSRLLAVREVNGNDSVLISDDLVLINGSGGLTITLPAADGNSGKKIIVKKVDANAADTIAAVSGEQIDGDSSTQVYLQFEAVTFVSDGTRWLIV
jgi:hypothetical protein